MWKELLVVIVFLECAFGSTTCYSSLNFNTTSQGVFVNGERFYIKGASWFGFETSANVVNGLWMRSYGDLLDFLKNYTFNAIRLPFYLELALNDAVPNAIDYNMNPDLQNLSSLQVLDKVVEACADRGIIVLLDMHCFLAGSLSQDGLWYDAAHPESMVLTMWDGIIKRYANQWNVVALDLKNEPWAATWGTGNVSTDWNQAVQRIADHIHSQPGGSKYLIFAEGTSNSPSCAEGCFWGEDLQGAATNPITMKQQDKLVYSPHCYGPSVFNMDYFSDPTFPNNLPAIWQTHYGFVPKKTGQPLVIGEWGGVYSGTDETWMNAYAAWLKSQGYTDTFFWCLNPNSGDTGGLLLDDWKTPETGKLNLLQSLLPSPSVISQNSQGQYCITNP